ncbi:MAG: 1-(5-phosphoribosyl)-5-[(5-phosphoribosylamino)methylideneamino]imidazole-4-carboxamide isomerase [bacterium]
MSLTLIPAIDLRGGRCVRLLRGDPNAETVYFQDPVEPARRFEARGASWLHVVDLDGAFEGGERNGAAIRAIRSATTMRLEIGGGLRTRDAVARALDLGAERAIIGTAAIENPAFLDEACREWPGRIWVGIDARQGKVAVRGWVEQTSVDARALAERVARAGAAGIVYTDIARDGALSGPNAEETARVARDLGIPVIASGGVHRLEDLASLKPLEADGVIGVISGRALYEGTLDLDAAIRYLADGELRGVER